MPIGLLSSRELLKLKNFYGSSFPGGKPVKFDFPGNATPIRYVRFDSKKITGKTTTIVEMLKEKSTLVSELSSEEVYKFFKRN